MEPLSLIANLIAVAGAAASASEKLQKLASMRYVPHQILQLTNEVSDFRCVLASINETLRRLNENDGRQKDLKFDRYVRRLLDRGVAQLSNMDQILDSVLIHNADPKGLGVGVTKISSAQWLKKNGHLQNYSTALRDIRRDLSQALSIMTASEAPSVRINLMAITAVQHETKVIVSETLENISNQLESIAHRLTGIQPSLDQVQNMLQQAQLALQPPKPPSNPFHNHSRNLGPTFRIRTAIQAACSASCRCQCHRTTSLKSPQWMKSFIGLLFVGYSGTPLSFRQKPCNEISCQQQNYSILSVNYFFPSWFLHRMVLFRGCTRSLLAGEHMISVRTPRVVDTSSDSILLAQGGKVMAMQDLFSQHLASPFDTSIMGESLLHMAVVWKRLDMCKLLLAESADPHQNSFNDGSPVDMVWGIVLQKPSDPLHQELKHIFDPFLDPDFDLRSKRFSIIHQCVLGLNQIDLEKYLLVTTSEINEPCSLGRPPLFWAASSANHSAIITLLNFGARTDLIDPKGQNVLHRAVMGSDINVLRTILRAFTSRSLMPSGHCLRTCDNNDKNHCTRYYSDPSLELLLNQADGYNWTPLIFAAYMNLPDHVAALLDNGAMIDIGVPLHMAIQRGANAVVEILLRRGARTDKKDMTQENILHIAAVYCTIDTCQLLEAHKVCCISTSDRNLSGFTPLQQFDLVRQNYNQEDEPTFLEHRNAFVELLNNIDQRVLEHGCLRDRDASELGDEAPATASLHSNDDEFFEARSTFEQPLEELESV